MWMFVSLRRTYCVLHCVGTYLIRTISIKVSDEVRSTKDFACTKRKMETRQPQQLQVIHLGLARDWTQMLLPRPRNLAKVSVPLVQTRRGAVVQPNRILGPKAQHEPAHDPPSSSILQPRRPIVSALPCRLGVCPASTQGLPFFPLRRPQLAGWLCWLLPSISHEPIYHPPPVSCSHGILPFRFSSTPFPSPSPIAGHPTPRTPASIFFDRTLAHRLIEARWRVLRLRQRTKKTTPGCLGGRSGRGDERRNWDLKSSRPRTTVPETPPSTIFQGHLSNSFSLGPGQTDRLFSASTSFSTFA